MKKIKENWQIVIAILLVIIYLILISVQPVDVYISSKCDDLLMVKQAKTILEGKYLRRI